MADYNNTDVFRAGLYGALIHKNSANGIAMGQFPDAVIEDTTPADTEVSEALYFKEALVSIGAPGQGRITVSRFGGQQFRGRFDLGPAEFQDFQLAFSDDSPSLAFVASGAKVNTTEIAGVTVGGENPRPVSLNNVGGIFTVGAQSINRTTGAIRSEYIHFWMPSFTLAKVPEEIAGIQSSTTNPYNSTYNVAVQETAVLQNGRLLSVLDIGVTSAYRVAYRTPYKNYSLTSVIFDGTDVTFTLPRLPLLDETSAYNYLVINGAKVTPTDINLSTGVVTLAVAPTAGHVGVMWYPLADQS
jgi:hypothetical protein